MFSERKINIAVVFGGKTYEHIGSVESALYILSKLDTSKYNIDFAYIDQTGKLIDRLEFLKYLPEFLDNHYITIFDNVRRQKESGVFIGKMTDMTCNYSEPFIDNIMSGKYDAVFPVIHGKTGEDGMIQGFLEFFNVPYVGCGILPSAASLDKEFAKRIASTHNIKIAEFITITKTDWKEGKDTTIEKIISKFKLPIFIKPATLGSSIGIERVTDATDIPDAIDRALSFDNKIIIERSVIGKEYGIAVIGNENPRASVCCEYQSESNFLDYEAKFGKSAKEDIIPANLDTETARQLQNEALKIYKALNLNGLSRIDFFIENGNIIFNEINSMPGFGLHSVFSAMWEKSGLPFDNMIEELIDLALEKFKD